MFSPSMFPVPRGHGKIRPQTKKARGSWDPCAFDSPARSWRAKVVLCDCKPTIRPRLFSRKRGNPSLPVTAISIRFLSGSFLFRVFAGRHGAPKAFTRRVLPAVAAPPLGNEALISIRLDR